MSSQHVIVLSNGFGATQVYIVLDGTALRCRCSQTNQPETLGLDAPRFIVYYSGNLKRKASF